MARSAGKWGRAVELSAHSTTQEHIERGNEHFNVTNTVSHVLTATTESEVVNLFDIGASEAIKEKKVTKPFRHKVHLCGPQGRVARVWANVDDGAMREVMSLSTFERIKHKLGTAKPSSQLLRVANGVVVQSKARWEGEIEVDGVSAKVAFEVFDSGGKWDFLFGKMLLEMFKAVHDYELDVITIRGNNKETTLRNQAPSHTKHHSPICVVTDEPQEEEDEPSEINVDAFQGNNNLFTRMSYPFKKERVDEVLRLVTIGSDLSPEERHKVEDLVRSFADIFALSVSEVKVADNATHQLNIPPDATFPMKVNQKPLTPPQRKYLYDSINAMLEAGVIEACKPEDVKCISPTTLAQKTHQGKGHALAELQHRVNDECIINGMEPRFNLPPRTEPTPEDNSPDEIKWRICQNFAQINKITKVAPMPQGDIRAKQQRLSGHRWVSGFDFAAGFYAVVLDPEARPYTAFYVEGRGYFRYLRMPFGLTGAPSTFAVVTADNMYDLLADEIMELFVDDGGAAANTFEEMMDKLTKIFTRVRERNLSLSASKCELFMSEMVFAGASVGPKGVQPDLKKLTAIVNWKTPKNAAGLAGFLGLTGWFRDLIMGYAKKEQPLRDLLRGVELPDKYTKSVYRRVMANYDLTDKWSDIHTSTFLNLKAEMTAEPVLWGPKCDGTPFIITTDSQHAFGAVLSQKFKYTLPSSKTIQNSTLSDCIKKDIKNRREVQTVPSRICCAEVRFR